MRRDRGAEASPCFAVHVGGRVRSVVDRDTKASHLLCPRSLRDRIGRQTTGDRDAVHACLLSWIGATLRVGALHASKVLAVLKCEPLGKSAVLAVGQQGPLIPNQQRPVRRHRQLEHDQASHASHQRRVRTQRAADADRLGELDRGDRDVIRVLARAARCE